MHKHNTFNIVLALCTICLALHAITGSYIHEVIGTLFTILAMIHIVHNRSRIYTARYHFSKSPAHTRKSTLHTVASTIAIIMMACIICLVISGVISSTTLYRSIRVPALTSLARSAHLTLSCIFPYLCAFHAGMHARQIIPQMHAAKTHMSTRIVSIIIAAFGAYAFAINILVPYVVLHDGFEYLPATPIALYIVEVFCQMLLFAFIGYITAKHLRAQTQRPIQEER